MSVIYSAGVFLLQTAPACLVIAVSPRPPIRFQLDYDCSGCSCITLLSLSLSLSLSRARARSLSQGRAMVVKQGISVNKEIGRGQLNAAYGGMGEILAVLLSSLSPSPSLSLSLSLSLARALSLSRSLALSLSLLMM